MSALVAFTHMAAENGGAAVLDRVQNTDLVGVQQVAVFFSELNSMRGARTISATSKDGR